MHTKCLKWNMKYLKKNVQTERWVWQKKFWTDFESSDFYTIRKSSVFKDGQKVNIYV